MKRFTSLAPLLALLAALAGCQDQSSPQAGNQAESREVKLTLSDAGYQPALAEVPRGVPLTLVVTRTAEQTCATQFVIPGLDRKYDLPLNQAVRIELPQGVSDTLSYTCPMNMIGGTIVAK